MRSIDGGTGTAGSPDGGTPAADVASMTDASIADASIVDASCIRGQLDGYASLFTGRPADAPDLTSDDYAATQEAVNVRKTTDYLLPRARSLQARRVLDVGCGVGAMVKTFHEHGYEAYGVDLPGLQRHWQRLQLPPQRMFIVDPGELRLPFHDGTIDFAFTLGAIEHVGTTNGHSDRRPDYHAVRRQWLRELYRVLRPGGAMLLGGPNRQFPVDAAHGPDSRAAAWERWLSRRLRVTVHRTWGGHFLWAYQDVRRYLDGLPCTLEPQSIDGFLDFGRVPAPLQRLARAYVRRLPRRLWGTGFNPWMMVLVEKPG